MTTDGALAAGASLEAQFDSDASRVRFRCVDADQRCSEWSGWFAITDEPIRLAWAAFEWA